jgi:hypothetical protein
VNSSYLQIYLLYGKLDLDALIDSSPSMRRPCQAALTGVGNERFAVRAAANDARPLRSVQAEELGVK